MLTPFTSNDDVRALLGVSSVELSDTVLNLPVYEIALRRKLRAVWPGGDLIALFLSIHAVVKYGRTKDKQALHDAVYHYSSVAAAAQAGLSLALVAPKRITDDKSGVERFSDSPYRDVLDRLEPELLAAKGAVLSAIAVLTAQPLPPTALGNVYFVAAKRGYDPVTGA